MLIYLIFIFSVYFGFLIICIIGWQRFTQSFNASVKSENEFVSVIVAFRNEEHSITQLLDSLGGQDFSHTDVEVILVDDHSSDRSIQKIETWKKDHPTLQCKFLHSKATGKKHALMEGIHASKGRIILTTDADCILPTVWISQMVKSFKPDTNMVIGLVAIRQDDTLFSNLQAIEFSSLMGSGVAMNALGFPVMCNGASLAFRKKSFEAVNGYEDNLHIPSGDDEFLMRKLQNKFPGSIQSVNTPDTIVITRPQPSLKSFFHQRLRWAGKWKANGSLVAKGLALFILILQLSILVTVSLLFNREYRLEVGILLGIKLLLEGFFLLKVSQTTHQRFSITAFLLLQLIYPFYLIMVGLLSQVRDYEWKGRKVTSIG